ncbi:MAG: hypothetical protein AB2653_10380, partial [Candidatus Thiodiazotropha endolucinida]
MLKSKKRINGSFYLATVFWLATIAIFSLAGCKSATADQQDAEVSIQESVSIPLESRCDQITQDSEYQYVLLSGRAIVAEKSFLPGDCFRKDCQENKPAHFFAYLESKTGERFRVLTAKETYRTLYPKPNYMEKGRNYSFCAREREVRGNPGHNDKVFQIDHTETISEIEIPSIRKTCDRLSKNSEYEYNVIEGEVYIARVVDPHALVDPDCTGSVEKCKAEYYARPASFTFALKPTGEGVPFRVNTAPETLGDVLHKEPYMAVGKRY